MGPTIEQRGAPNEPRRAPNRQIRASYRERGALNGQRGGPQMGKERSQIGLEGRFAIGAQRGPAIGCRRAPKLNEEGPNSRHSYLPSEPCAGHSTPICRAFLCQFAGPFFASAWPFFARSGPPFVCSGPLFAKVLNLKF